jgi:hypothetical protein
MEPRRNSKDKSGEKDKELLSPKSSNSQSKLFSPKILPNPLGKKSEKNESVLFSPKALEKELANFSLDDHSDHEHHDEEAAEYIYKRPGKN